jgi:hypothetical protein
MATSDAVNEPLPTDPVGSSQYRQRLLTLALVLAVSAGIRVWLGLSVPLVITNDGAWYLTWALDMLAGNPC